MRSVRHPFWAGRLRIVIDEVDPSSQCDHGKDIHLIMVKNLVNPLGIPGFEIVKIEVGNPFRGNIIHPFHTQKLGFEGDQATVVVSPFPDPSGGIQKIEIWHLLDL